MRINGKESFLGHMWVEYLDVKTGKIEKFGFELDESKSLLDTFFTLHGNSNISKKDDEYYLGKSDFIASFVLDDINGKNSINYWNNLENDTDAYSSLWNSCIDKVIESFRAANVKIGTGDGEIVPSWNIPFVDAASKKDWQEKSQNLTKEEKEKIEIFMDMIKHDTLKDDDFKHLAKLPLKELQIFHEEFLLIEQERARILEKHKELGAIGISNVLKMNLEQLKQFEKATEQFALYDPIALDLDGNGKIDTLSLDNGVFFDHNGDDIAFKSSWISGEDGILARDIDGDGKITSGAELFGNKSKSNNHYSYTNPNAKDGFEALKEPDSNNDGIISNLDENFDKLQIWQDSNSNGVSETNELKSLSELGIESLNLNKFTNLNLLVA
ncbi:hypothetical protein [Candidatus Campylobacter infans]|nr:hypothetical protein [Candidatus Campylobacter infans]